MKYAYPRQLELAEVLQNKRWWETSEGIEWLSSQQDVEEQFFDSQKVEKVYKIGQRVLVRHSHYGAEWSCILAQVESNRVCFIDLESGNRVSEPICVFNAHMITEDEMEMIAGDCTF